MKKLLIILLFCVGTLHADDVKDSKVLLLSFARSGNTWMRYSIEYFTKRPTCTITYLRNAPKLSKANNPIGHFCDLGIDDSRVHILKMHHMEGHADPTKDYLILVIRNYKECLIRELHNNKQKTFTYLKNPKNQFCNNIREFDKWPEKQRLLIYYEDLISQPEEVYKNLTTFLDEGTDQVENFVNELAFHKQSCIDFYNKYAGPSVTQGKKALHHSKKFTSHERLQLDQLVRENLGDLFSIYLDRYVE